MKDFQEQKQNVLKSGSIKKCFCRVAFVELRTKTALTISNNHKRQIEKA